MGEDFWYGDHTAHDDYGHCIQSADTGEHVVADNKCINTKSYDIVQMNNMYLLSLYT